MILAKNKIEIPEYLYHNSAIKNKEGNTVAMILAINNLEIPKELEHDSKM